jgi:hypothetical protein
VIVGDDPGGPASGHERKGSKRAHHVRFRLTRTSANAEAYPLSVCADILGQSLGSLRRRMSQTSRALEVERPVSGHALLIACAVLGARTGMPF